MEDVDVKQASFEGWAVVEMMGHRKEIGFVTTQAFGQAVLFRVDVPELPEREFVLESPEYANANGEGSRWCPVGTKVKRAAVAPRSCLVAPSSLYAINPCSEDAAMRVIERSVARPLIVLELPPQAALSAGPDIATEGRNFMIEDDDGDEYGADERDDRITGEDAF